MKNIGKCSVIKIFLLIPLLTLPFSGGCAFIPTPVRLINKPHSVEQQPSNGIKICIIVKDERPEPMQKINMCGLMRNGYMIPTSIAFLAHKEHLDEIVAYHMKNNLEHLGYTVVGVYPSPPSQLSQETRQAGSVEEIWAGMKVQNSQQEKGAKKKGKEGVITELTDTGVLPWGPDIHVNGADVVIEVKIRKFFSDCNWFGVFAWASMNMTACRPDKAKRTVLFGKKLKGFGYGTGITPIEAYGIPINVSYWFVIHAMEKAIASPEFQQAIKNMRTQQHAKR